MIRGQGVSVVLSASGAVTTFPTRVLGMGLSGGSDAATLILKDGGSSGTVKTLTLKAAAGTTVYWNFPNGITFSTDVYAAITGTSPSAMVIYEN